MDNRTLIPLQNLIPYEDNFRNIDTKEFQELKNRLQLLTSFAPLLITPNPTDTSKFIVLSGNMRLRALQELATEDPKFGQVWCQIITFVSDENGLFHADINGNQSAKTWLSVKDAMFEYSVAANSRSGYYDADSFTSHLSEFNLDLSDYAIDFSTPVTLESLLNAGEDGVGDVEPAEDPKEPEMITCPSCNHIFPKP